MPLLIKLPHTSTPARYDQPINGLLIHDLVVEWIDGKVVTAAALTSYLDQNRGKFPVHVAGSGRSTPMAERLPD